MNKDTLKVISLIAGILTAIVALFYAISGIVSLTNLSGDLSAKINIYIIIVALFEFAIAVLLGAISYFIIMDYVKNNVGNKWLLCASGAYFAYGVITVFFGMCYFGSFDNARGWITLVLAIAGFVLALLALIGKFEGATSKIIAMIATVIGFVLSIVSLTGSSGLAVATNIFIMLMFIALFLYFLFDFVINNSNSTKKVEE